MSGHLDSRFPFVISVDASDLIGPLRGIRIYSERLILGLKERGIRVFKYYSAGRLRNPAKLLRALTAGDFGGIFTGTKGIGKKALIFHGLRGRAIENPGGFSIITLHDLYGAGPKWLRMSLQAGVHGIVTPSQFTKHEILKIYPWLPENSVEVIHMGIDHKLFKPYSVSECEGIINRYGLGWKSYWIFVGSAEDKRKNFENMAEGARLAGVKLFHPRNVPHSELACLIAGAYGMVFVTLGEGFGLPPIEAMACGTPVVVSKSGSLPEVTDGAAVYVDDPLSPDQIAEAIRKLKDDPELREKLAQKGLSVAARYQWERTISETLRFYRRVVDGKTEFMKL